MVQGAINDQITLNLIPKKNENCKENICFFHTYEIMIWCIVKPA